MSLYYRQIIFYFFFFFAILQGYAQKAEIVFGIVKDSSTVQPITDVIIIAKINGKSFYGVSDTSGKFYLPDTITHKLINIEITLTAKHIDYEEKELIFKPTALPFKIPDILLRSKIRSLSEVIIVNKPIVKKGDTTIFTVAAFSNKLDANLEDALKKMPGMDVDNAGNIRYNNKPIENIMIEGDVVSKNYKLISKNITPDMVDKVEVIDKYNENQTLKDLTNSQKQTMNLVLKNPKKLKIFGTLKTGLGIPGKINTTGSLFAINNKIKTMAIFNKNNIGISPYSDYSVGEDFARKPEYDFPGSFIPNYITENKLFTQSQYGNNVNSLFNNSTLGVLNSSIKIKSGLTLKIFTDIYADKIKQVQQTNVQNNLFPSLSYSELFIKRFLPENLNNNAELKWQKRNSQLLIMGSYISKKYKEINELNSNINYNSLLASKFRRLAGAIYYTHRIDSVSAFEISFQNLEDKKDQQFSIFQDQFRLLDSSYLTNFLHQYTANNISTSIAELKYLFKRKRTNQISLKMVTLKSDFDAFLNLKDSSSTIFKVPAYNDTTIIKNKNLFLNYNTGYNFKKISLIADLGLLLNDYRGDAVNSLEKQETKLFFLPKFVASFSMGKFSRISANIGWDLDNPNLSNTYLSSLLSSYRLVKRNNSIPLPMGSMKFGLNYYYTNLNKATSFLASYNHSTQDKTEIRNYSFTSNFDYYENRYDNRNFVLDNVYLKYDKYLYRLKTAIGIKQSFVWFNNPTEVSGVSTSNKFFSYNASVSLRPTIKKNVNFNVGSNYQLDRDLSSEKSTFQINPFIDFTFTAGKKLSLGGRCNYFNSNYNKQKRNYVFANVYAWYNLLPKKLDAKFTLFNLLNSNVIINGFATTAISKSVITQILPRFALFEFIYKL